MLEELNIKDFALIDSVSVEFMPGFNILSGETGAGKSILIGALSFLLGGKAGTEVIRTGAAEARVSGTLFIDKGNTEAAAWLSERGMEAENGRVLLRRMLRDNGRSAAWIQDTQVTRTELADFTSSHFDIHGQHEHNSIMKVSENRRILDSFAGITEEVIRFTELYSSLVEKRRAMEEMNTSDAERAGKIELLTFAADEIENASLSAGEEDELTAEESRLGQFEKLYGNMESVTDILSGGEGTVVPSLKKVRSLLEHAVSIDPSLDTVLSRFENAYYEFADIADGIRAYKNTLVFDPARLEQVQERLALIFRLKKKYGTAVSDVIAYAASAREQLERLVKWEGNKAGLEKDIAALEKEVYRAGRIISSKRAEAAQRMAGEIERVLRDLGMTGTRFSVGLSVKEGQDDFQRCGPYGFDDIEFLIRANPGSPLRPLAKIASGGELSRVMLAIKTVLADSDTARTLVFDEIDTGIGGEVSVAVGSHLKKLSVHRQILCITHLASIAVYADNHIKIEKSVETGKTTTRIYPIEGQERVGEIARMLSGDAASGASLDHARSLLEKYGNA